MAPPTRHSRRPWSKRLRRWAAGVRQIVETADEKGHHPFGLSRERPHELTGFQACVAATMALPNCWIWCHEPLGRPTLAVADLVDWSHDPVSHQAFVESEGYTLLHFWFRYCGDPKMSKQLHPELRSEPF